MNPLSPPYSGPISGKTLRMLYMAQSMGSAMCFVDIEHQDGTITSHDAKEIPGLIARAERERRQAS